MPKKKPKLIDAAVADDIMRVMIPVADMTPYVGLNVAVVDSAYSDSANTEIVVSNPSLMKYTAALARCMWPKPLAKKEWVAIRTICGFSQKDLANDMKLSLSDYRKMEIENEMHPSAAIDLLFRTRMIMALQDVVTSINNNMDGSEPVIFDPRLNGDPTNPDTNRDPASCATPHSTGWPLIMLKYVERNYLYYPVKREWVVISIDGITG